MKSTLKTFAAASLLLAASSPVFAANPPQIDYLNAQLALGMVEDLDDPLSLVVTIGKHIPKIHPRFAVEGEFSDSIDAAEGNGVSLSYWMAGGYGVMTFPVDDRMTARARAGLRFAKAYANGEDDDDLSPTLGIGIVYRYAPNTSFLTEFTYLGEIDEVGVNHLSAGVQIRF